MLGAEAAYAGMENELQSYLDSYESTYDFCGLCRVLRRLDRRTGRLSRTFGGGVLFSDGPLLLPAGDRVTGKLRILPDIERQYTLTETVTVETRYDEDDEPYEYSICTVTLDNFDLSHLPVYLLDEEGMSIYAVYIATLGNRPDLFPASEYPNASQKVAVSSVWAFIAIPRLAWRGFCQSCGNIPP